MLELAGVKDILTKSLGSSSKINVAKATMLALSQLRNPKEEGARRKAHLQVAEGSTQREEAVTGD